MGKVKKHGAPRVTTDKLQRVLNVAACILTGTHKFDRGLSWLLHTELHWLDIPERVIYKLGVTMFSCQHGRAPQYLIDCRLPVSDVASRQHLCLPVNVFLVIPYHHILSLGFYSGWPDGLELFPRQCAVSRCHHTQLQALVKTFLFSAYQCS